MSTISSPAADSWPARAFTVWCLAAAALAAGMNLSSPRMHVSFADGRYFYLAGRMFVDGRSPYSLERFRNELREIAQQHPGAGRELGMQLESYVYPPASLIVFAPLALLDYPLARQLFSFLNVLLMLIAAWMVVVYFDGIAARQRPLIIAAVIVGLLHRSFPTTLNFGQCDIFVFVALAGTLLAIDRRSAFLAAACGAIATIKPQVTLLPILALVLRERAWREGVMLLGAVMLSNLVAMLVIYDTGLLREMIEALLHNLSLEYNQPANRHNGLFLGARSAVFAAANLLLIPAGVMAVLLAALKRDHYPKHTAVVASIVLTLYAMPLHFYSFVLLLALLVGCLTINLALGVLLIALAIGIDRDAVTQAILARIPGGSGLTHQALDAVYILIAFVAVQGYVFLRYATTRRAKITACAK